MRIMHLTKVFSTRVGVEPTYSPRSAERLNRSASARISNDRPACNYRQNVGGQSLIETALVKTQCRFARRSKTPVHFRSLSAHYEVPT